MYCGRGNTPDDPDTMDEFWAIDLERDMNWGDSTYICKYCCDVLAATAGFVTMDQLTEQMNINQGLKKKVHDLQARLEQRNRRLDAIAKGQQAIRRTKKERAPVEEPTVVPKKKRKKAA
jgi:hypothetical protein